MSIPRGFDAAGCRSACSSGRAFFEGLAPRRAPLPAGDRLAFARADGDAVVRPTLGSPCSPFRGVPSEQGRKTRAHRQVGTRTALTLHAGRRADGSQVAGEYVVLATLARRFVEGESSPELGVTVLKEGTTPILFGRPPIAELRGTWRDGVFKGTRYGPGGQKRSFEFSEELSRDGQLQRQRALRGERGPLSSPALTFGGTREAEELDWRAVEPGGQPAVVASGQQRCAAACASCPTVVA